MWSVILLLVVLLAVWLPLPIYVVSPGPAFSLGEVVTIDDSQIDPINGDYLFLTVQLDEATLSDAVRAGFDGEAEVVSRAAVLNGESEEDFVARQESLFDEAEATAISMGLELAVSDLDPSLVVIDSDGVGGPSAGLLMTLAVADLASPVDVANGRTITGTGRVEEDGSVGPVGGIQDKVRAAEVAGADVFLVPVELAGVARDASDSMTVVEVESVGRAFQALSGG